MCKTVACAGLRLDAVDGKERGVLLRVGPYAEIVGWFLELGVDVGQKDGRGRTALSRAIRRAKNRGATGIEWEEVVFRLASASAGG